MYVCVLCIYIRTYACTYVCVLYVCLSVTEDRNSLGVDRLYVHQHHKIYPVLKSMYETSDNPENEVCPIGHSKLFGHAFMKGPILLLMYALFCPLMKSSPTLGLKPSLFYRVGIIIKISWITSTCSTQFMNNMTSREIFLPRNNCL